jgi:hypothetical protein
VRNDRYLSLRLSWVLRKLLKAGRTYEYIALLVKCPILREESACLATKVANPSIQALNIESDIVMAL